MSGTSSAGAIAGQQRSAWQQNQQENEENTMKRLFGREVYIRLTEDGKNFACTTRYGKFFTKTSEFVLDGQPALDPADHNNVVVQRKEKSSQGSSE